MNIFEAAASRVIKVAQSCNFSTKKDYGPWVLKNFNFAAIFGKYKIFSFIFLFCILFDNTKIFRRFSTAKI